MVQNFTLKPPIDMSRIYIAEKPSLARAIAAALPTPHTKCDGYIRVGNGDCVTWCIGHLLEQVPPDSYDPRYKRWSLSDLPILPSQWRLAPRSSAKKQLAVIGKLLKTNPPLVHAGDPDREGQLLVDEVINYLKYPIAKRGQIERLLISDLNPSAVRRALQSMRSNSDFSALSTSALARSRADWLYGMNMSRAYTLLGQRAGYQGVLSVGRVQTPVLGLVVRRDDEIAKFVSKPYFEVDALVPYQDQEIRAKWQPSEACRPYQDEENRVLHKPLALNVAKRVKNQPAQVTDSVHKNSKQPPPLPYSLSALQIDAARRYNMRAAQVLASCQSLYEKHKAITYPRSDCRYLPTEHLSQVPQVISAITSNEASLAQAATGCNQSLRSRAWNDAKVSAHHAIIPTPTTLTGRLSGADAKVYQLIARQYLMQFYPAAVFAESKLVFQIAGGTFLARSRHLTEAGWRTLLSNDSAAKTTSPALPVLKLGQVLTCKGAEVLEKKTEPPKPFNEATLLLAMTGIGRFVNDPSLRKILRETDGLGTEATRASILEGLFKRCLLLRQGKEIHSSAAGKGLIYALPEAAAYPDMTAQWERELADIADTKNLYAPFMQSLEQRVTQLMDGAKQGETPQSLIGLKAPPRAKPKNKRPSTYKAKTRR